MVAEKILYRLHKIETFNYKCDNRSNYLNQWTTAFYLIRIVNFSRVKFNGLIVFLPEKQGLSQNKKAEQKNQDISGDLNAIFRKYEDEYFGRS